MAAIAVAYGFGVYLFPALMPQAMRDLRLSDPVIGLLLSARQGGFVATSLVCGPLAMRFGCATVILWSLAVIVLGLAAVAVARNAAALILALVVLNSAAASIWIPMVPLVAGVVSPGHRARVLGFVASGTNYGVFADGILVSAVSPHVGWRSVFLLTSLAAAVLLAVSVRFFARSRVSDRHPATAPRARAPRRNTAVPVPAGPRAAGPPSRYVNLTCVALLGGCGGVPFISYWSSYGLDELHLGLGVVGWSWSMVGTLGMAGGFAMGWLADRWGVQRVMVLAVATLGLGTLVCVSVPGWPGYVSASALFGLTFFPIYGLIPTYIAKTAPPRKVALVTGATEGALGLGAVCGSAGAAALKAATGSFSAIYLAVLAVCAAMLVLVVRLVPDDARCGDGRT